MSQWYLSKEGKAVGPLSEDKIIDMIQAGRATHLDLVYRSGDSSWLPISQVNPFAQYFNQQEPVAQAQEGEPEWVLLKRVESEEGSQFKQIGPFAQSEVLKLIDQGEIRFSDFAWKTGMDNWSKISELEVFAQPLPSTPPIDKELYESTQSKSLDTETLTDNKARQGLSEMVKIEHYDSEKTVVTRTQNNIPLNNEDFVTELDLGTDTTDGSSSQSDVDLWSLEPPKKPGEGRAEPSKIQTGTSSYERKLKTASEHRKKSSSSKKKKKKRSAPPSTKERLQLGVALAAMFLAFIFFYKSLKTPSADRRLDALVVDEVPLSTEDTQAYQDNQNLSFGSQNQNLEVQSKRQAAVPTPAPAQVSSSRKNREVEARIASQTDGDNKLRSRPAQQASAPPSPAPTIKKLPVARDKQPEVKPTSQDATPNPVKVKKTLVPPPKNKPALRAQSVSEPKSTGTRSKTPLGRSLSSGSAKSQSFYKQRDRKALFYSSLRAETLAAEIEAQYQKLHKNKTAWSRYYAQWRKKAQSSLAKDIQNYPLKKETYAYPQLMGEFKKDFNLIFKYGETFDQKVKGGRVPSDAPRDVQQIFAQHRKKAQSLGL
jgi:hypothetical protein